VSITQSLRAKKEAMITRASLVQRALDKNDDALPIIAAFGLLSRLRVSMPIGA
jgi:hypothetical protein